MAYFTPKDVEELARFTPKDIEELARHMCIELEGVDPNTMCSGVQLPLSRHGYHILPSNSAPYQMGVMEMWRTYVPVARIAIEYMARRYPVNTETDSGSRQNL